MFSAPLVSLPVLGLSVCPIFFLLTETLRRLRGSAEVLSQCQQVHSDRDKRFKASLCLSYVYVACCISDDVET